MVLHLLTSFFELLVNSSKLSPLQLIETCSVNFTVGPEREKRIEFKNQMKTSILFRLIKYCSLVGLTGWCNLVIVY